MTSHDLNLPFDSGLLETKLVGKISGQFVIEGYQRGYRWGRTEVQCLLDDIFERKGRKYNLQPIVVKKLDVDKFELVDGQQRLTTLYLILLYVQRNIMPSAKPLYRIEYTTRPGIKEYLETTTFEMSSDNIDYYHIWEAYSQICAWFEGHGSEKFNVALTFYQALFNDVSVIWYVAPSNIDATTLFRRLNVGRIPLTDAELVKAVLLSKVGENRAREFASQWDAIERDLHHDDIWAFIAEGNLAGDDKAVPATRISMLLDAIADLIEKKSGSPGRSASGGSRPLFHTFNVLQNQMLAATSPGGKDPAELTWEAVADLHARILGWFEDRELYHKIGYLMSTGARLLDVIEMSDGLGRSALLSALDKKISRQLNLSRSTARELRYDGDREKCLRLLLLMNVEAVRRTRSGEIYPFRLHRDHTWSLEHIHAQNSENLTRAEQWREWLRLHKKALEAIPAADEEVRQSLLKRVDDSMPTITGPQFQQLAREILEALPHHEGDGAAEGLHGLGNLALMSSEANSVLNNAVFEVKRQRIIELDRAGEYVPICTRQVFLKYFTGSDFHQIHFWGPQDQESYLDAMFGSNGLLNSYVLNDD